MKISTLLGDKRKIIADILHYNFNIDFKKVFILDVCKISKRLNHSSLRNQFENRGFKTHLNFQGLFLENNYIENGTPCRF